MPDKEERMGLHFVPWASAERMGQPLWEGRGVAVPLDPGWASFHQTNS